jgi:dihydrofolate synthase / folylpolyglutamate synthase
MWSSKETFSMNYLESKTYLESLTPTTTRPTLERMRRFMEGLATQADVPCIHIGGTNGKGSTVAIADSILRSRGFKVGRFTGPHLLRWNERFHVDGKAISDEDFARLSTELRAHSEKFAQENPDMGALTWFEFLTAIAFMYFAECKVDVAVMEVGLGGRFDATTVRTNPYVTVITNVSLDHTHLLGDTVEKIAFEKAGIIEPGISVVTACQDTALDTVLRVACEKMSPVYQVSASDQITLFINGKREASSSDAPLLSLLKENLSLKGSHQLQNGLVALLACAKFLIVDREVQMGSARQSSEIASGKTPPSPQELVDVVYKLDIETLSTGLRNVRWPGRLQYLPGADLLLDGAHNPAGAQALRASLDQLYPGLKPFFVISSFESKDAQRVLTSLVRPGERVFVAEAQGRRSSHSKEYLTNFLNELGAKAESFSTIPDAVDAARARREKDEFIVISGSFAAIKETMQHFGFACVEDSYLSGAEA